MDFVLSIGCMILAVALYFWSSNVKNTLFRYILFAFLFYYCAGSLYFIPYIGILIGAVIGIFAIRSANENATYEEREAEAARWREAERKRREAERRREEERRIRELEERGIREKRERFIKTLNNVRKNQTVDFMIAEAVDIINEMLEVNPVIDKYLKHCMLGYLLKGNIGCICVRVIGGKGTDGITAFSYEIEMLWTEGLFADWDELRNRLTIPSPEDGESDRKLNSLMRKYWNKSKIQATTTIKFKAIKESFTEEALLSLLLKEIEKYCPHADFKRFNNWDNTIPEICYHSITMYTKGI